MKVHLSRLDRWIDENKPKAEFMLCSYDSTYVEDHYGNIRQVAQNTIREKSDVIVTLGGDGTILSTVSWLGAQPVPILGVNLGGLGFLAETAPENFLYNLASYLKGRFFVETRSLLTCRDTTTKKDFYALNDIVIDKAGFHRVIEIVTKVDDQLLNRYIADGLILSSPTGSTGYSLSAGGPIVVPQSRVMIINPICPHSLTNRPVVVPEECTINIQVFTEFESINIFRDGKKEGSYPSGTSFEVQKADFTIELVQIKTNAFYETLRNKLGWGEDFRDKNRWSYQKKDQTRNHHP